MAEQDAGRELRPAHSTRAFDVILDFRHRMITPDQARAIFLTMPVVEHGFHYNIPDFRVKDKIFATILPGLRFANLKVGKEEQIMLVSQARLFSIPRGGGRGGWISVNLAAIAEEEFLALVWKAWRHTAPPRLSLQY